MQRHKEKLRCFNALRWPSKSLAKVENEVKVVHRRSVQFAPVFMQTQLSLTLSLTQPIHAFWVIKGKEKKQIIFLYISVVVFLCYTTV